MKSGKTEKRTCKDLSVIVSVYNESLVLPNFFKVLKEVLYTLALDTELIFVNDGSTDNSLEILNAFAVTDEQVKIVSYLPNKGHETAMYEGIKQSRGEVLICLDADLQHPPTFIPQILQKKQEGFDVVLMVRTEREDGGWWKKLSSRFFYALINFWMKAKIEPNASDFFMISNKVAVHLLQNYPEQHRFLRGFIQLLPYSKTTLPFVAPKRLAGESKYSFWKLLKLSISAVYAMKQWKSAKI